MKDYFNSSLNHSSIEVFMLGSISLYFFRKPFQARRPYCSITYCSNVPLDSNIPMITIHQSNNNLNKFNCHYKLEYFFYFKSRQYPPTLHLLYLLQFPLCSLLEFSHQKLKEIISDPSFLRETK